jgi:flavodoxin
MKALITYYTMTNRTKKVAETIAKSLSGYEVTFAPFTLDAKKFIDKIKQLDKVEHDDFSKFEDQLANLDAKDYDLVIFGSPNYGNVAPKTIKEIIMRIKNISGKKVAVFITGRFNGDNALLEMRKSLEQKGSVVIAEGRYSRFFRIRDNDGLDIVNQIL